jgi:hypothetical protein
MIEYGFVFDFYEFCLNDYSSPAIDEERAQEICEFISDEIAQSVQIA